MVFGDETAPPCSCSSSQLQVLPLERTQVESRVHEPLQLIEMGGLVPCRRSSCRVPSHIPERNTDSLSPENGVQIFHLTLLKDRSNSPLS